MQIKLGQIEKKKKRILDHRSHVVLRTIKLTLWFGCPYKNLKFTIISFHPYIYIYIYTYNIH